MDVWHADLSLDACSQRPFKAANFTDAFSRAWFKAWRAVLSFNFPTEFDGRSKLEPEAKLESLVPYSDLKS
jgi:hypothetical protein